MVVGARMRWLSEGWEAGKRRSPHPLPQPVLPHAMPPPVEVEALALPRRIGRVDGEQRARDPGEGHVELQLEARRGRGVDVDMIDDGEAAEVVGVFGI